MITNIGIGIAYVTIINWRIHMKQYIGNQDFRGRPVVRSLPANAEVTGSNPCLTSYLPRGQLAQSHVPQRLGPHSGALRLQLLNPRTINTEACVPRSLRSTTRGPTAVRSRHTPKRRSPPHCN